MSVFVLPLLVLRLWKRNRKKHISKLDNPVSLITDKKMYPKSLFSDSLSLSQFFRSSATPCE